MINYQNNLTSRILPLNRVSEYIYVDRIQAAYLIDLSKLPLKSRYKRFELSSGS